MTNSITKRTLAGVLAVLCIAGTLPAQAGGALFEGSSITANALDIGPISVYDIFTSDTTVLNGGTYVVQSDIEIPSLTVESGTDIKIDDGCTLTVRDGITIAEGQSLIIGTNGKGTGRLVANAEPSEGDGKDAVNGELVVYSGTVEATGGACGTNKAGGVGIRGALRVFGGTVIANGAASGDGYGNVLWKVGNGGILGANAIEGDITVEGGTVIATGGRGGNGGIGYKGGNGGKGGSALSGNIKLCYGTFTLNGGEGGKGKDSTNIYSETYETSDGADGEKGSELSGSAVVYGGRYNFNPIDYVRSNASVAFVKHMSDGTFLVNEGVDPECAEYGHSYLEPEWTWTKTEDGYNVTAEIKCKNGDFSVKGEAIVLTPTKHLPDENNPGGYTYKAVVTLDRKSYSSTYVQEFEYGKTEFIWSDDHSTVTATRRCLEDFEDASDYDVTETVAAGIDVIKEATCCEDGLVRYYDTGFKNSAFKDLIAEIVIETDKLPHSFGNPVWEWTQTSTGYTASVKYICSGCGETEEYPATVTRVVENGSAVYTAVFTNGDEKYVSVLRTSASNIRENPAVSFVKGDNAVKLSWNKVEGAEKYAVAVEVNGNWKLVESGPAASTSYVLNNLKPGTNYKVAVIAMFDGEWNMDFSNAITVTPNAPVTYPETTVQVKGSAFQLNWTAVPNAKGYAIAYTANGKTWKLAKTVSAKTTSFTYKNAPKGTFYLVVCANVNGKYDTSNLNKRAVKVTIS